MKRIFTILMLAAGLTPACKVEIGDECELDVDCSANMDRYCDRSQPSGYCLIIGCGPGECPGEASCVEFTTPCPTGEGYEDDTDADTDADTETDAEWDKCRLIEPNRGRTYCLKHCNKTKDCRGGYQCVDASELSAAIIDLSGKHTKICVPKGNV